MILSRPKIEFMFLGLLFEIGHTLPFKHLWGVYLLPELSINKAFGSGIEEDTIKALKVNKTYSFYVNAKFLIFQICITYKHIVRPDYLGRFKVSVNWDSDISLDEMMEDCAYCFTNSGYKGYRPRIYTKRRYKGMNLFEIDYDNDGLITCSEAALDGRWEGGITSYSNDPVEMIKQFLNDHDGKEFIN